MRGDSRLIRIMLDNLIGNAWKYTRDCDNAKIKFGRILSDDILDALVPGHGRLHFPRLLR